MAFINSYHHHHQPNTQTKKMSTPLQKPSIMDASKKQPKETMSSLPIISGVLQCIWVEAQLLISNILILS